AQFENERTLGGVPVVESSDQVLVAKSNCHASATAVSLEHHGPVRPPKTSSRLRSVSTSVHGAPRPDGPPLVGISCVHVAVFAPGLRSSVHRSAMLVESPVVPAKRISLFSDGTQ